MPLDYETLRLIWWALLGILLIGFAITDGFDLGVGALLPFVGRTDGERRLIINSVGPVWEGNQVWLILGGGASFAAWPPVYAVSFSGFYFAIFLALFAIILRPVGFKFRSKMPNPMWRSFWDWALFVGGTIPAFIFGVAFGNLFLGVDFHFDENMRSFYTGSFWHLLTPFAFISGFVSLAMVIMHGGIYLTLKTEGVIASRSRKASLMAIIVLVILFSVAGFLLADSIEGYRIESVIAPAADSNPLSKYVRHTAGAWLQNYFLYPWMLMAPIIAYSSAFLTFIFLYFWRSGLAFITSSLCVFGIISTAGLSLFPFLLPSSSNPNHSLTVWDASSSHLTLFIMFLATVFFMPIILVYTAWVYRLLRGKVTQESIDDNSTNAY